jgi:AraC-like DNA-binding protein
MAMPSALRHGSTTRIGAARFAQGKAFGGYMALAGRAFETRLPPHVHSTYVLGVVDGGSVRVTVNGTSYLAGPGSVIALEPFVVHTELPDGADGWSFRYVYPTEAVVREALGIPGEGRSPLRFARPVLDDPGLAAAVGRVFDRLEWGATEGSECDDLATLVRQLRDTAAVAPEWRPAVDRRNILAIRDMLTERPLRSVRLADLASEARLSQFHFARVFRSEVGLPPYAFFEQVRIAHAHALIHSGRDLTTVAYQLGYADQSHLTRHFRRGSFTTPGHFAQLSRASGAVG